MGWSLLLASTVGFRNVTVTDSEVVGGLQPFDFWMDTLFIGIKLTAVLRKLLLTSTLHDYIL